MSGSLSTCVPVSLDDCPEFISTFLEMGRSVGNQYNPDSSNLLDEVSWRIRRLVTFPLMTNQPLFWISNTPFGGMIIGYKIEEGEEKVSTIDIPPVENFMAIEIFNMLVQKENGIFDEALNHMLMIKRNDINN